MLASGEDFLEEVAFETGVPKWREQNLQRGRDSCGGGYVEGGQPLRVWACLTASVGTALGKAWCQVSGRWTREGLQV